MFLSFSCLWRADFSGHSGRDGPKRAQNWELGAIRRVLTMRARLFQEFMAQIGLDVGNRVKRVAQ